MLDSCFHKVRKPVRTFAEVISRLAVLAGTEVYLLWEQPDESFYTLGREGAGLDRSREYVAYATQVVTVQE